MQRWDVEKVLTPEMSAMVSKLEVQKAINDDNAALLKQMENLLKITQAFLFSSLLLNVGLICLFLFAGR